MISKRVLVATIAVVTAACGSGAAHKTAAERTPVTEPPLTATAGSAPVTTTTMQPRASSTTTSTTVAHASKTATRTDSNASAPAPTTVPVCVPVAYDPAKPVNLCGTPGVTPEEEARAEQLVRDTLRDIPKYANVQTAYNAGYRSIGDSDTHYEHYIKWALVNDNDILDPAQPESLVYHVVGGTKTLVAAMYMTPLHTRFTDLPDLGGPLTQWHLHNNLCFQQNPDDHLQLTVIGHTDSNGNCPDGATKAGNSPMIHVWIVSTPCGPFASLEGDGGGQVAPGESHTCDHLHGTR